MCLSELNVPTMKQPVKTSRVEMVLPSLFYEDILRMPFSVTREVYFAIVTTRECTAQEK